MKAALYLLKLVAATGVGVGVTFAAGYLISLLGYVFVDVTFYIALALTVWGAFAIMKGNGLRNRPIFTETETDPSASATELERERQDIETQGSVKYVLQNRTARSSLARVVPFATGLAAMFAMHLFF